MLAAIPLPKAKGKAQSALVVSNFQAVERDFAFVGNERIAASDIIAAIEKTEKQLIQSVNVFDIYTGKGVEPGQKSIAISVTLQALDRTLTEQEIEAVAQKIIAAALGLGLKLRQ
jgi:phenylalanyl-tRNA synthetase beta chain